MARNVRTSIDSASVAPPFGNYSHGLHFGGDVDWLVTSGQLGISKDGAIPEDVEAQAELCFRNLEAILAAASMSLSDVVRLCAYVTRREHFVHYMRVRDRFVGNPPPVSTLLIVGGFTRPEMLVEVEATAVRPRPSRRARPRARQRVLRG